MRFEGPLLPATSRARPNRFLGEAEMDGETIQCFIPNPGRMRELLYPDAKVCLLEKASGNRRTSYDLVLVKLGTTLVSIDSRVPNKIVEEAINAEALPEFRGLRIERSEPVFRESRLDFLLAWEPGRMFLEVKPCTLVEGRTALFPDAPTTRGTRHIQALISALKTCRSALFFLVQRSDTDLFSPNDETDHKFSMALREAVQRGVEVYAYNSRCLLRAFPPEGRYQSNCPETSLGSIDLGF